VLVACLLVSIAEHMPEVLFEPDDVEALLLAFLCLEASACSRDELIGRFWSDAPENKARASLRQTLYVLNRELSARGYNGLAAERFTVEIDRRTLQLDLNEVLHAAEAEHRAHPLLLETAGLSEMLLAGYDHLAPSFQDWLRAKRQIVQDRIVRGLENGLRDEKFDSSHKISLAQVILNLDATHEEACRFLMRARAEAGDLPGALRAYKALWDLLEADYDISGTPQPPLRTAGRVARCVRSLVARAGHHSWLSDRQVEQRRADVPGHGSAVNMDPAMDTGMAVMKQTLDRLARRIAFSPWEFVTTSWRQHQACPACVLILHDHHSYRQQGFTIANTSSALPLASSRLIS
jgi:DNA-binding SARP family transcriptional activator